jgi:glycosyltransferase involved in cell wall biosynthesis
MENYPKIAILIPTYNRENYLNNVIKSVLYQDYPNLEIIISDDASTDNTKNIINRFMGDKRLKYYRNNKNLGAALNVKKLIYDYLDSEWFMLKSDDEYLIDNEYISKAMTLIKKDSKIVIVHGLCRYIEEHKHRLDSIANYDFPEIEDGKWYFLNWGDNVDISAANAIWNTKLIKNLYCFSTNNMATDWEAALKVCLNGKVGFIRKVVSVFKFHEDNGSSNLNIDKVIKNSSFIDDIANYAKDNNFFSDVLIDNWKKKTLSNFFKLNFEHQKIFNPLKAQELYEKIKSEYPFAKL